MMDEILSTRSYSCAASRLIVPRITSYTAERAGQGRVCCVGGFSQGIPFFRISIHTNKSKFSDPSAASIVDSPASFASYTGEAARGHWELLFARGEVCQNSTPSTGSSSSRSFFTLAPSSLVKPRPASRTTDPTRQGMGCHVGFRRWRFRFRNFDLC